MQKSAFPNKDTNGVKGVAQALALFVAAVKFVSKNTDLYGFQDTLFAASGRQYLDDLYIEGTIDYIYGNGNTYIENSELKHVGMAGGYTTAASTDQNTKHGYETTSL